MKKKNVKIFNIILAISIIAVLLCSSVISVFAVDCGDGNHLWTTAGVCDRCGAECRHDFTPWGNCYYCNIHSCEGGEPDTTTGNCRGCGKHVMHVWDGYGVCKGCPYECPHTNHAPVEWTYCYDCGLQDDDRNIVYPMHDYNLLGTCTLCGYEHEHSDRQDWYSDENGGYCLGCGALCKHEFVQVGICSVCAWECNHPSFDSNYTCACGYKCTHNWQLVGNGSDATECVVCGAYCGHGGRIRIYTEADEYGHYIFNQCDTCGHLQSLGAEHHENDGVECTKCGYVCAHNFGDSKDGNVCVYCGFVCLHRSNTVFDNVVSNSLCGYVEKCSICSYEISRDISPHSFDDNDVCTRCGKQCNHIYSVGACIYCEKPCVHHFVNGSIMCAKCGFCIEGPTESGSLAYDLILSIFDAEVTVFNSVLNYTVLGINIAALVGSIIVLVVVLWVIKKVK